VVATSTVDALAAPRAGVIVVLAAANHMTDIVIGFSGDNASTRTATNSTATPGRRRGTAVVAVVVAVLVAVLVAVEMAVLVAVLVTVVVAVVVAVPGPILTNLGSLMTHPWLPAPPRYSGAKSWRISSAAARSPLNFSPRPSWAHRRTSLIT
jgi:hypothetical protein